MNKSEIDTVIALNESLNDPKINGLVESSKIKNPGVAVEGALVDFLTSRFEKIERDAEFTDLIRMHIRQRLPEASFDQLITLLRDTSADNNKAVETLVPLFKNEQSGKTVIDQLRDDASVANAAQSLYQNTDRKDILQAVSYLSQVLGKINNSFTPQIIENK